jgi:16S rRNA (cytosine1402-N4)-methyltransferase
MLYISAPSIVPDLADDWSIEPRAPWSALMSPARHKPVLLRECIDALAPADGGRYLDGTFGAGGHTRAILEAADCKVLGLDRDRSAITGGTELVEDFESRLVLAESRFSDMDKAALDLGFTPLSGVLLDLGVSSMQLDQSERGFSFRHDGPLDMRMGVNDLSAADIVNQWSEADLSRTIATLGEEKKARFVARAIVDARKEKPIRRTGELADIVRGAIHGKKTDIDPATRTFQALRMLVNEELQEVAAGLMAAEKILKPGGRLAVISFHSLEDRLVKMFFASRGPAPAPSRHQPETGALPVTFKPVTKKPIVAPKRETDENPRARSAKLRVGERTSEKARSDDPFGGLLDRYSSLQKVRK